MHFILSSKNKYLKPGGLPVQPNNAACIEKKNYPIHCSRYVIFNTICHNGINFTNIFLSVLCYFVQS